MYIHISCLCLCFLRDNNYLIPFKDILLTYTPVYKVILLNLCCDKLNYQT